MAFLLHRNAELLALVLWGSLSGLLEAQSRIRRIDPKPAFGRSAAVPVDDAQLIHTTQLLPWGRQFQGLVIFHVVPQACFSFAGDHR